MIVDFISCLEDTMCVDLLGDHQVQLVLSLPSRLGDAGRPYPRRCSVGRCGDGFQTGLGRWWISVPKIKSFRNQSFAAMSPTDAKDRKI